MNLAETQRLFWELLQGSEHPLDAFVGSPALPAEERIAIYARMFLHRQIDALREMFPKVVAALGDEAFFEVAARYVHAHPSQHPDLGQLGRRFAGFLDRSDLRDLARLEWARSEVFEARPAEPLSAEQFALLAQDPDAFMNRRVQLIPALRLLELEHDIGSLWDETAKTGEPRPTRCVVWRSGFDVFHVAIDEEEARAVQLAMLGAAVGDICGAFGDAARAAEAFQGWLAESWIAA
ncbi:MAG TPA: DNA-binding domain-containing protein [Myxococcales bacterium]|jgi:hypothetical protein|nr:DNA-binding domain-containing protein [Myxococcales bacterium]